jgi:hypothetical protein
MAPGLGQSERDDELSDVAAAAAFVLSFLEVPDVPAITLEAFASILATGGLVGLLVFALTGIGL